MRLTGPFNITILSLGWHAALVVAAAAVLALPVAAQSLDSTLDDIIDDQIDEQVEDDVAEALEENVEQQVEEQVEQQVESEVAETIEQQVESSVTETVEQQIQSEVVETIQQEVESGVTEGIGRQLENVISKTVEGDLGGVLDDVDDVTDELGNGLEEVLDEAEHVVEGAGAGDDSDGSEDDEGTAQREQFFAAIDAAGRAIERDVWVILLPQEYAARIEGWGFTVRERQNLVTLDRVLLRVDAPEDRDIAQAALELALDAPGTLVDFNHVYRGGADADETLDSSAVTGRTAFGGQPTSAAGPRPALAIGIIDSAVANEHAALYAADIVQKDFVPFDGTRPLRHGTAVASILVGESRSLRPRMPGARLYAASVFFDDDAGEPAATTASLVASLEWLAAERVGVVNMSLAGPPNRVLEAALDDTVSQGALIVAAVGNNGPVGEPLYPAAYDTVVGVTAVDSANRIYPYASRGRQVTFAAPGVRIRVARSDGGYATETGTSMAAPYAAAIIAQSLAARAQPADAVLSSLEAAAIDLGDKDFDDVFGFGLIAAVD
jgi:hypothetical protein